MCKDQRIVQRHESRCWCHIWKCKNTDCLISHCQRENMVYLSFFPVKIVYLKLKHGWGTQFSVGHLNSNRWKCYFSFKSVSHFFIFVLKQQQIGKVWLCSKKTFLHYMLQQQYFNLILIGVKLVKSLNIKQFNHKSIF